MTATSDVILERMMALHPKIIDLTLDRVWRLLAALGNPQDVLPPVIHIAGTNGKGSTLAMIRAGTAKKGDVLGIARIAGIMAAKKTPDLIPLCHPLPITKVAIDLAVNTAESCVDIEATIKTTGQTGIEMEALTAVSVTALTVYDMVKAVDKAMHITDIRVVLKDGGKSGLYEGK
jgi:cyclic pyranopterin phosphate synthase